jgi:hypothetical protein
MYERTGAPPPGATATGDGTRISKKISHPPEVRTAACGASMRRASVGPAIGGSDANEVSVWNL